MVAHRSILKSANRAATTPLAAQCGKRVGTQWAFHLGNEITLQSHPGRTAKNALPYSICLHRTA